MPKTDTILSAKSLRYFLQLIDTMNYTQAAQILGITQPALTQQVKKLEHAIGAPLLGQMGKKLYLTEAGKEMETAAVELLNTINGVVSDIQEYTQADKGHISVGILNSLQSNIFYQFLGEFNKKYPDVTFTINYFDRKELWRRLDTNQVDMAIIYLPDNAKKEDTNLRHQYNYESFYDDKLVILTHKTTVEAGESYPVSRFVNRKWVAYPDNFYLTPLMHGYFGKKNKPIIPIKIGSTKELIKMAENSDYDTFITQSYYDAHRDEIDSTNLTPIYLKGEHGFTISYVYRKGKLEIPRMQNLLKEWEKFLDKHQNFSKLLVDQIKS
ncbi:LysR family transcriptional regulator [Lactobacillus helveticus]|uniref:LysR family transcriptional regulator n=1 Tax=Lactobacillus helveticus TaxID=1587 RepID=UPI001C64CB91|nr:LysR family transcriptional regulator [Lactobacillus helveticus]MBW8013565.1 LysR family transcriptional regulator [Lactobacillus helveticus]